MWVYSKSWSLFIWLCVSMIASVKSVEIDNGITARPDIHCDAQALTLKARTKSPFTGRIYIKGESTNPECSVNYTHNATVDIEMSVSLTSCNIRRVRIPGSAFEYTTSIVVSFHGVFETKVDKAYRVHCIFAQLNNTFTAPSIEVSMIPTTEAVTETAATAQCTYDIRRGSVDGPPLRYATIGESVFHVWKCETVGMRILVRDCYVDDGGGNRVETIDSKGCALDRYLLQTPTYVGPDYNMVYTETHVFKYADRPTVLFQCQIQFCDTSDDACRDISPPTCGGTPAPTSGPIPANYTGVNFTSTQNYTGTSTPPAYPGIVNFSSPSAANFTSSPGYNVTTYPNATSSSHANVTSGQTDSTSSPGYNVTTYPNATSSSHANATSGQTDSTSSPTVTPTFGNLTNETTSFGQLNATDSNFTLWNSTIRPNVTFGPENATGSNATQPSPTPRMTILEGGANRTNETLGAERNATRRIRSAQDEEANQLDTSLRDVVSNELTVTDLEQELQKGGQTTDSSQRLIDDSDENERIGTTNSIFAFPSLAGQKNDPPVVRCISSYDIALIVSLLATLMITTTAAIALYWNVKRARKQSWHL